MTDRTIHICGKDVKVIYCTATENSFEDISGKSIGVFVPEFKEEDGKTVITAPAEARIGDYVMLGIAGIIAASTRDKEEMPITSEDILFNATPSERNTLITTIRELRNEWYGIPTVVEELIDKDKQQSEGEENGSKN
jgi:hypothetical protein